MLNFNNKSKLTFLTVLAILSLSTIMPALVFAAPLANSAENWDYVNANSWGWNYSPQTQINKDNADNVEVKWIFPLQATTSAPAGMQSLTLRQGTTTPPIVHDGLVYVTTNYLRTYAVNATTGKQAWAFNYQIDIEETLARLPLKLGGTLQMHLHGFRYWEGGNALLLAGWACDFYGIDADTGKQSFWAQDLCLGIEGNIYLFNQGSVSQTNIGTWDSGRQFIFVLPGTQHSSTSQMGDFRHTTIGVDMDTLNIVWRIYSYPPQGVLTKDWALQECDIGFFRDIPCSAVAAQIPGNLEWDWTAQDNEPPHPVGGVTANWGEIIVDEDTGIAYTQTGNQGPYTYIGLTRGPRLYGSTIYAIDLENGVRLWWNEPMPRDPYDYDCNWGGVLAEDPTYGKVYMKGCKEGILQIMDAATGEPVHLIDVAAEQQEWGQTSASAEEYPVGVRAHLMDPFSQYDMKEMVAPDGSPYCGDPCNIYPFWMNGIFGTDMSYDPQTNTLFHYALGLQRNNLCTNRPISNTYEGRWESGVGMNCPGATSGPQNTTIVARDVTTGEVKWTWYYNIANQRAHMVITPGLMTTGFTDGFVRFFDTQSGELLNEINVGSELIIGFTTGVDDQGNQKIFTSLSGAGALSPTTPGTLVAFGLNAKAAEAAKTVTVTSTSRTTLTSTSTSVSTSTTTATTTSVSTSVSTTTAQGQTQTVTSQITEEVGMSSTITYAAVAVALIAIIAVALIYTKKIKI